MKPVPSILVGLAIAVGSAAPVHAQPAPTNRAAIEKDLIAKERAALDAFAKVDLKRYFQVTGWEGIIMDPVGAIRATETSNLMATTRIESFSVDDPQVQWLSDDAAVVTYRWTGKATRLGQPLPAQMQMSTVWSNRGGTWVVTLHQESMAPVKPNK